MKWVNLCNQFENIFSELESCKKKIDFPIHCVIGSYLNRPRPLRFLGHCLTKQYRITTKFKKTKQNITKKVQSEN